MAIRRHRTDLLATTTLSVALAWAGAAFAQDPAGEADESVSQLGEIVVTAQRREQRLQDVPVAVTALSVETLEQLNIGDTQDLMSAVPSLQVSTQTAGDGGGSATFFLRGMGQQRSGNGSEPAVGIYVDDFYYPSLSGTVFDIVDLAQVEVLRGPQGTLFGRNTIGGAIRYSTRSAVLGETSAHVSGTLGSFDRRDVSAGVNLPLGEFAALRLTAGRLEQDGFVRVQTGGDDAGATRTDLVRVQLRVEPTDAVFADLSAQYSKFRIDGFGYNVPGPMTPVPPSPGAAPTLPFIYNSAIAPGQGLPLYTDAYRSTCFYCQYGTDAPEFSETKYSNLLATLGWNLSDALTLKSLTGWQKVETLASTDLDSTPLPVFGGAITRGETTAFSQELQLNGQFGALNFVSGLYYYNEESPGLEPLRTSFVLGARQVTDAVSDREVTSYAAFVDGSYEIGDRLTLLGGFRYSEDEKVVEVFTPAGAPIVADDATFDSKTYRIGVQYAWTDDVMTYANVSTGFRGGGFNPYNAAQGAALRSFAPETAKSYEIGARLQFWNRRVTFNPTAFYVNWDDIQVQSAATDTQGNVLILLQNAGKARSHGVELEGSVNLTDSFRLFGNVAYLDLEYTDIGTATGITLDSSFQRAPELTYAIGGAYTHQLASGAEIVGTLNYSHQDEQNSTPTDADTLRLRAYDLLNARIEFSSADERFTVALYASNALDEEYAIGGVNYYSNVGAARYDLGRPREIGVTARVNF